MNRLKELVKQEEEFLTNNGGTNSLSPPGGAASLELVKEVIRVLEKQQERIKILESMDRHGSLRLKQEDI